MNLDQAISELTVIRDRLDSVKVLAPQGHAAIENGLRVLKMQKKEARAQWQYEIGRDCPLAFRATDPKIVKHKMEIDIYGMLFQPSSGIPQGKQSITVRVWCLDKCLWYDSLLDAPAMEEQVVAVGGRRVMLRFRFDFDDPDDEHPWCHLQIGGRQMSSEHHRMPENLSRPRFIHHPMNLLMACEFVVRHFYPEALVPLSKEASWRHGLGVAQKGYLQRYLIRSAAFPRQCKSSFLEHMWVHQ